MLNRKKWLAAWVALLMMLAPLSLAFAGDDGTLPYHRISWQGGETAYAASAVWHNPPLVDEETNAMLASLLGQLRVSGMSGVAEGGAKYGNTAVAFGDVAIPFEWYSTEDGLYVNSPLLGGAVGVEGEDLPNLLANVGEILQTYIPDEQVGQAFQAVSDALIQMADGAPMDLGIQMEEAQGLLDALPLEELAEVIGEWGTRALASELYEGEIVSKLGVSTSKANVYALTKAELLELLDAVLPMVMANEAFLEAVIDVASVYGGDAVDAASLKAEMGSAGQEVEAMLAGLEALIPDDMRLQYIECLDDAGSVVLCEIEVYIPNGDEGAYIGYLEMIPGTGSIYLFVGDEANGVMATTSTGTAEATTSEGAHTVENTFMLKLSIIEELETVGTIDISVSEATFNKPGEMEKKITLALAVQDTFTQETYGFTLTANEENVWEDEGPVSMRAAVDVSAVLSGQTVPIITIEMTGEAGGNAGASFDPASFDGNITRLGQLDQAQYLEWSQNVLMPGITQTMLLLLSALPQELMQVVGGGVSALGL